MDFTIYRETKKTGVDDWGTRRQEDLAIDYGRMLVNYYTDGEAAQSLARRDDELIGVRVVERRSGDVVFEWKTGEGEVVA